MAASKAKTTAAAAGTSDTRANLAASYNWSITLLNSDPELKALFNKAVAGTWNGDRFGAELKTTNWYQKHSDAWRASQILKTVDPKTWAARIEANTVALRDQAATMGATLSDSELGKIVNDTTTLGWTPSQQQAALSGYVRVATTGTNAGQYLGAAGQQAQQLRATAEANGYKIQDDQLSKWNQSIAAGTSTTGDYEQFMRRQAALTFPSFSQELYAGANMKDLANPYINSMSQILETPATNIDLFDPTIRSALASTNQKTGQPQAMAMYDFENRLRQDPRWQYTTNAKQQAASSVLGITRLMGLAG